MKTRNMLKRIFAWSFLAVLAVFQGCEKQEIDSYRSERFLFFERWNIPTAIDRVRIDTAAYSFSDYVGENELVHPFVVKLIGDTLTEATEYKVIVVDTATTALAEQYALPDHLFFRKGAADDTLKVTLYKKASLKDKEVVLTLRLMGNDHFKVGYVGYSDVKIRFNDMQQKPAWWDEEVEVAYLGTYSFEKLKTIVAANEGFSTFDGLSGTERRKIAMKTKEYIQLKGITEINGEPMIIPVR